MGFYVYIHIQLTHGCVASGGCRRATTPLSFALLPLPSHTTQSHAFPLCHFQFSAKPSVGTKEIALRANENKWTAANMFHLLACNVSRVLNHSSLGSDVGHSFLPFWFAAAAASLPCSHVSWAHCSGHLTPPFFYKNNIYTLAAPHIYNRQLCTHLKSKTDAEQRQETEMERNEKTSASTAATLCVSGPNRCRRGTKACSASLGTVRHYHLCGARNP